jgi:hypothetical protein
MRLRNAIILIVFAEAIVIILATSFYGWDIDGLQITTRYSGRLSLLIFSFIFLFHPGAKGGVVTVLSKDYFLMFAIAHGIHLIELLSYVLISGVELVPFRLAGGFLAYVLIFLMPWLQLRFQKGKINASRLNNLEYAYLFYVWFIFFMTYFGRLTKGLPNGENSEIEHVVLMGWVCLMFVIKMSLVFVARAKKRA